MLEKTRPEPHPLSHPFNLVVDNVNRVLMRVHSLKNEYATYFTGQVLDYPGTIPYSVFHPT